MSSSPDNQAPVAVILAAGKGTRMGSDLPKVVHPVGGRAMVCAVVEACRRAGCARTIAIVGHMHERVREALAGNPGVEFVMQEQQLGTGHAVACAHGALEREIARNAPVLVLCGDGPLVRAETLTQILDRHGRAGASATLATAVLDDPGGYGRIIRDAGGRFERIVEDRDASPAEKAVREVNPSYYCFNCRELFEALPGVRRDGGSGETYLTDVLPELMRRGRRVEVIEAVPPEDVLSVNTPEDLALVDRVYRERASRRGAPARSAVP
jgi:bifunctional UDP-N-acetylglucosamine pyrophosphorylase/glucosamine-1-phosphate N-acetyltransferase